MNIHIIDINKQIEDLKKAIFYINDEIYIDWKMTKKEYEEAHRKLK